MRDFSEDHEAMAMCMACGHTFAEHTGNAVEPQACGLCSCDEFSTARVETIAADGTVTEHRFEQGRVAEDVSLPAEPELTELGKIFQLPTTGSVPVAEVTSNGGVKINDPTASAREIVDAITPKRTQILRTANKLINGDRQASYGDATKSFERLGRLWSEVIGVTVTAEQVALCLVQLKVSRLIVSSDHADSWVDLCGYGALGGEIADKPLPY